MFNVSVIGLNNDFQEKIIIQCKKLLFNKNFVLKQFNSITEFMDRDSYLNIGHILIIDEFFLTCCELSEFKKIHENFKNIQIIFYGNNIYSILNAYSINHIYFILKDTMHEKMPLAIKKGIRLINQGYQPFFTISFKFRLFKIYYNDVIRIRFKQRQICFITLNAEYTVYISRNDFFNSVDRKMFLQISYRDLINIDYVKYYVKPYFIMNNNQKIKVTPDYVPIVEKILNIEELCLKSNFMK